MSPSAFSRTKAWAWGVGSYVRGLREFWLDARRYLRRSSPSSKDRLDRLTGTHLEGQLVKDYHRVEKGLSLNEPRRPFGRELRARLQLLMDSPGAATQNPYVLTHVKTALSALDRWNDDGIVDDEVSPRGDAAVAASGLAGLADGADTRLFVGRRSVRNFDPNAKVDHETIRKAVRLAGLTPSVCNRQPWKTYVFTKPEDVARVLKHHSGNVGFGPEASGVAIVTVDVRFFSGAGERNQRWVDGGLFAMSFVFALQHLGVSTCMLNWSRDNASSQRLREEADIPLDEDIVVLIAFGYPRSSHRVARSPRRPLDELLHLR